jgi:PAS domain-containing protein
VTGSSRRAQSGARAVFGKGDVLSDIKDIWSRKIESVEEEGRVTVSAHVHQVRLLLKRVEELERENERLRQVAEAAYDLYWARDREERSIHPSSE